MNESAAEGYVRMCSDSCDNEPDAIANCSSASNMDLMPQNNIVNNVRSILEPSTLKDAHVEKWSTQHSEYNYNKKNISDNKNTPIDHQSSTVTPLDNYQEHATIFSINDSLTEDCDKPMNNLAPAEHRQIQSSDTDDICLTCREGTLLNSPCNSKDHFMYLMWEMTSDPIKRAKLETLPVTSLESCMELIRRKPNVSRIARQNMLKLLDDFREMNDRNQSTLDVQLQKPNRDSEVVDTLSVPILLQPMIQNLEFETFKGENINSSTLTLTPMTEGNCKSGTDENCQALTTPNSCNYPEGTTMPMHQYDNRNYPYENKWRQNSNSITHAQFKKSHVNHHAQSSHTSDSFLCGQTQHASQVPLQSTEHVLDEGMLYSQCNYSENSEEFSSELDEEPLTLTTSSPSVKSQDSGFTSTQFQNKSTFTFAHPTSVTHLKQSIDEHADIPSSDIGTLVLRYKKRRNLPPNAYGATARSNCNQQLVNIPSLSQIISGANTLPLVDELCLHRVEENARCAVNKSLINSMVAKHDRSIQCRYRNLVRDFKSNGSIYEKSLPTTLHVGHSGSPDMISNAKYPTGISSSLATSADEHTSQETLFESSSDDTGSKQESTEQSSYDVNQSTELNILNVSCEYILADIRGSMAIVD